MIGDHLVFNRGAYTHHAIRIDEDRVVHFQGFGPRRRKIGVRIARLADVAHGGRFAARRYAQRLDVDEIVARALRLVGRDDYHLLARNCEHLATWCSTGEWKSDQVRAGIGSLAAPLTTESAAYLAPIAVAALGRGVGGAAMMTGLTKLSFGGHPFGGVVIASAVPAAIVATIIGLMIPHDEHLSDEENRRRMWIRNGGWFGAAGGTTIAATAVHVAGSSASGAAAVATGLKRVGGSMGKGLVLAVGIAAAGALVGILIGDCLARRPLPQRRSV